MRKVSGKPGFDKHFLALPAAVRSEIGALVTALRIDPDQPLVLDVRWTRTNASGQCETIVASGYRLLWSVEEPVILWDILPPLKTFTGSGYPGP